MKKKLLITGLLLFTLFWGNAQNIIDNYSFETGLSDWDKGSWGGGEAAFFSSSKFSEGSKSAQVKVTINTPDNAYKVYMRKGLLSLIPDEEYTLSFDLMSQSEITDTIGCTLYSHTNIGSSSWGEVWKADTISFEGNGQWHTLEYTFTASALTGEPDFTALGLMFGFGINTGIYHLDNVCLRKTGNDCTQETFSGPYYVAKSGSDANPGTKDRPFLSIGKAAAIMQAGDTCFIKEGVYRETLNPANHGTANAPIVFKAFEEEEVTISATEVLNNWETHSGSVYKTAVHMLLGVQNMLYYNGQAMDIARWPNNVDNDPYTIDAQLINGGTASSMNTDNLQNIDWSGAYVWYLGAHSGTSWTRPITSNTSNTIHFEPVDVNKWPFSSHNPTVKRHDNYGRFYVFGKLAALDYEREWYYDKSGNTLYFQAPGNANPNDAVVEYAAREQAIYITKNYIQMDGINAFGGKVHIKGDYCVLKNGEFRHCLQRLDELDNTDAQLGSGSIHIQGSNNLIENNLIEYGSHNGVWIQGWGGVSDNTVQQNVIRYFNTVGTHSSPVRCPSSGSKILYNSIYTTGRDGVFLPAPNCELAYNDIYDCMRINNDGGMFYVVGNDDDKNTKIHHNWFHDTYTPDYADGRAAGIYLDNRSKGYEVHHNVVWNVQWSAVQMNWDAWNNDIFNNSFWNVEKAMGIWLNGYQQINNQIWNNYSSIGPWEGQDFKGNVIDSNDPFSSIEEKDFRPATGSALIDQGVVIDGITDGYLGTSPDVGAYEWGAEPWIPGAELNSLYTSVTEKRKLPQMDVLVYPNPTNGNAHLIFQLPIPGNVEWVLYDPNGKAVLKQTLNHLNAGHHKVKMNTATLPKGIYFLFGRTNAGYFNEKVVVF